MKTVFIKTDRCVGCRHCELACSLAHGSSESILNLFQEDNSLPPRITALLGVDYRKFPLRCQHCDPAPCLEICPTRAIYRDDKENSVLVEAQNCISCGMCAMVCPYSAIEFPDISQQKGEFINHAYKCDDCIERLREDKEPACAKICRTGALQYGDMGKIVSEQRDELAVRVTENINGEFDFESKIPENMELYRQLQKKMAELGPFPASKKGDK